MVVGVMSVQRETTVWLGTCRLVRGDPFFATAVQLGQKYVDEKARGKLESGE
jgi:hypothetical protein